MGLTILTIIIKSVIILITDKRKMRKLEKINRRRSAESILNLLGNIYFGNDNLIVFVNLIMRFHRFHRLFAVKPPVYIIGKSDIYFETFFPITILIKILILIF
jgi:hypothetical protein